MSENQNDNLHSQRRALYSLRMSLQARRELIFTRRTEIETRRKQLESMNCSDACLRELNALKIEIEDLQQQIAQLQRHTEEFRQRAEALLLEGDKDELMNISSECLSRTEHVQTLLEGVQHLKEDTLRQSEILKQRHLQVVQDTARVRSREKSNTQAGALHEKFDRTEGALNDIGERLTELKEKQKREHGKLGERASGSTPSGRHVEIVYDPETKQTTHRVIEQEN